MGRRFLLQLVTDESGQDLIEYALVAALLSLCAVASMKGLSSKIAQSFNTISNNLSANV